MRGTRLREWLDILLLVAAALLLVPVAVVCAECLAALLPWPRRHAPALDGTTRPRSAVLIPAHNEEAVLARTLRSIRPQMRLADGDRVLVVADNCNDGTADIARAEGCEVLERRDAERRGKGYALDVGIRHLEASNPPDVLVMMDADCDVAPGTIDALVRQASDTARPAQAVYLMTYPADSMRRHAVSALAFLVKNQVRPRGLGRLGLPCLLTGTGMAFPWSVIREAKLASGNIVEDMQLGIDLALAGHPATFCEAAKVTGQLPSRAKAALGQRTRWEHGHLRTLIGQVPRLGKSGLLGGRLRNLALAMELAVPPLSLLVAVLVLATVVMALAANWLGVWRLPLFLLTGGLVALSLCILLAWARFGRQTLPATALLAAPLYVVWKLPVYFSFLRRGQKEWVRTERDPLPGGADEDSTTRATARPAVKTS